MAGDMPAELRLRPGALEWREVEGEIVALDLTASTYLSVNQAGAPLWRDLVSGTSRDDLIRRLVEGFGIEEPAAACDVDLFVAQLERQDLLER